MGSNTIVINGKHYDAKTGRLLETSPSKSVHTTTAKKQNGPSIDGFSRRPNASKQVIDAHAVHGKTEKSKTLMRGAVKKPVHNKVHATAHAQPANHHDSHTQAHVPADHDRAARAQKVSKSKLISRFGSSGQPAASPAPATIAHLPVKQAPSIQNHAATPLPTHPVSNPFQSALDNSLSHKQASPRKATKRQRIAKALRISPRMVSFGSIVLAGVLMSGFFVYQNIPNLAMKVAATRSGVAAGLPDYQPAGFSLNGPIKYSAGQITINYRSNSDQRAYKVVQTNSEWNNEVLLEKFVAVDQRPYQTFQDKGKTIYMYDESNATWIDQGVWYQVEGESSLSSDQLLRIANSL